MSEDAGESESAPESEDAAGRDGAPQSEVTPVPVDGCEGVWRVDTELFGSGFMSAYVVSGDADGDAGGDDEPDPDGPVAVVDPGPASGADRVVAAVEALGLADAVEYVVPTHVHLDHGGAAGALAAAFPDATVYCHEAGREYLADPDALARLVDSARRAVGEGVVAAYGEPEPVPPGRCEALSGGETLPLGDRTLSVVATPGHAPHQVGVVEDRDGALFAGDAAGMWLDGHLSPTTPPPDFDPDAWVDTLARLREHEPRVVCYGHFGARTDADAALSAYAEMLPAWVEAVAEAREAVEDAREAAADGREALDTDDARDDAGSDDAGTEGVGAVVAALDDRWQTPTVRADVAGVLGYLDDA